MIMIKFNDIRNISVMDGDRECGSIDMMGLDGRANGPVRPALSRRDNGMVYPSLTARGTDSPRVGAFELTYTDVDDRTSR